ncbi:acyltransferase [Bacillus sp. Marseille-Q3570]|uniref:acyltransferase n=1 Tax=Bacillus sp. Marseille-Q3570 TaxID=2963522 RepID=UPI0021B81C4E|nr:acyltransferase [Bacillus sp. Marseille-Q3570]
MERRKQIHEIYITRAIAIIGVLIVHATATPVTLITDPNLSKGFHFMNVFFKFGTTTFILLSSFVLFYTYYHRSLNRKLIGRFYKRRLLYILLPYALFSVAYFFGPFSNYPFFQGVDKEAVKSFIISMLTGKAEGHLYFVFISVQLYLMFPLFLWLLKKFPSFCKYLVLIGFASQWAFVILNHYYLQIPMKGSIAFSYFSFYFTGAFLGIYYQQIMDWLKQNKFQSVMYQAVLVCIWLGVAGTHIWMWYVTRIEERQLPQFMFEGVWNAHTFLSAIVLIVISHYIFHLASAKLVNTLIHLGVLSFGIYLIHIFALRAYTYLIPYEGEPLQYSLTVGGAFLAELLVSGWIVNLFLKRLSWSWIIFGAMPKVTPYKSGLERA